MALANYSELVLEVGAFLDRDDLANKVPTFVKLAEVRLNRLLRDPEMEVLASFPATGDYTALPADFGSMVSVNDGIGRPLRAMGSQDFAGVDRTISGQPLYYVIEDGAITFAPGNATANIRMVYRRTIPPLTADDSTNWLLTRAPDVYLYGALTAASAFLAEDDRVGLWKAAFDEAIAELRLDGMDRKWGAGPIAPRVKRP